LYWPRTTNIGDARGGHQIYHASAPAGSWSGPACLTELDGMDPDLTLDDEGTCLVAYCSWSENNIPMKPVIDRAAIRDDFARFLPQHRRTCDHVPGHGRLRGHRWPHHRLARLLRIAGLAELPSVLGQ
jgi:hypothetical protein